MLAGRFVYAQSIGQEVSYPPETTALGALLEHVTGGHIVHEEEEMLAEGENAQRKKKKRSFQPMNVNFGLFLPIEVPKLDEEGKKIKGKEKSRYRKHMMSKRALADLKNWITTF